MRRRQKIVTVAMVAGAVPVLLGLAVLDAIYWTSAGYSPFERFLPLLAGAATGVAIASWKALRHARRKYNIRRHGADDRRSRP